MAFAADRSGLVLRRQYFFNVESEKVGEKFVGLKKMY